MLSRFKFTRRSAMVFALLVILLIAFLLEIVILTPEFFAHPISDYGDFVGPGNWERSSPDKCSYSTVTYYPLPTILWVFVPLSLLPNWFVLIWMFAPFLFLLWLYRKSGVLLWLYYPMLFNAGFGQMDGWLLLPLYWLFENRRWIAGISAAILLFKPHVAFFAILYMLSFWLVKRDWRNLGTFAGSMAIFYIPAFFVCPSWPFMIFGAANKRASEFILPTRGATLWAWAWHGGMTLWLLPIVAVAAVALVIYVFFVRGERVQAVQLFGLLVTPILYATTLVTVIPTLKTSRQFIILTLVSWAGVVIDTLAGGWGGAYVIIPLTALVLISRENDVTVTPPPHGTNCALETIDTRPRD